MKTSNKNFGMSRGALNRLVVSVMLFFNLKVFGQMQVVALVMAVGFYANTMSFVSAQEPDDVEWLDWIYDGRFSRSLEMLDHWKVTVREEGACEILRMGGGGKIALPALMRLFADQAVNATVRANIVFALARQADDRTVLSVLVEALKNAEPIVRRNVATSFGKVRSHLGVVVDALIEALNDSDVIVRKCAAEALGRIDANWTLIINALARVLTVDADEQVRLTAVSGLIRIGCHVRSTVVLDALLHVLKTDEHREIRATTANQLARVQADANTVVVALIAALGDVDSWVRMCAAAGLGEVGPNARSAIPALIAMLKDDPDEWIRPWAANALGKIGPAATRAIPALIDALRSANGITQNTFATALGEIGPTAMPALVELIDDETADLIARSGAIIALHHIGAEAVPILHSLLTNPITALRGGALVAIGKIGIAAKSTTPTLMALLTDDSDPDIRWYAAVALVEIGTDLETLLPMLIAALADDEFQVRYYVAAILGEKIGPSALAAAPALIGLIGAEPEWVSIAAARALIKVAPDATATIEALIAQLESEFAGIRVIFTELLGEIGPAAHAAVPALIAALADSDTDVRHSAVVALGNIRDDPNSCVPALARMLDDPEDPVVEAAIWALKKFGPAATSAIDPLQSLFARSAQNPSRRIDISDVLQTIRGQ